MFFFPDYHKDNHCESHNNIVRLFKSAGLSGQQEGLYPSIYPDMAVCRIFFFGRVRGGKIFWNNLGHCKDGRKASNGAFSFKEWKSSDLGHNFGDFFFLSKKIWKRLIGKFALKIWGWRYNNRLSRLVNGIVLQQSEDASPTFQLSAPLLMLSYYLLFRWIPCLLQLEQLYYPLKAFTIIILYDSL